MDRSSGRVQVGLAFLIVFVAGCLGPPPTGDDDDDGRDEDPSTDRPGVGDNDASEHFASDDDGSNEEGGDDDPDAAFERVEWNRRINASFAPVDCPRPPRREYNDTYYKGPLIDTHMHIPHLPDSPIGEPVPDEKMHPIAGVNVRMGEIACLLKWEGTKSAVSFFPVFPHIDWQSLEVVNRTMSLYPDLFIPFIMAPAANDDPPTVDEGPLRGMLEVHPGLFRGYGEIGLYSRSEGGRDLRPDDPILKRVYLVLREHKLVAYLHPGDGHAASLDAVLTENPDLNLIVHGDQIAPAIGALMDAHDNVFFTANDLYGDQYLLHQRENATTFLEKTKDFGPMLRKDWDDWKAIIEAHPDQFMWGTDRGGVAVWTYDHAVGDRLSDYGRAFIGGLDPAVQERFAFKNAERLFSR
ncbi:MAG: hypothetical protein HY556_00755 [Euryarchaeota archaeon]|nr:hypothetical protein [Euryarchaeota archaeon]